VDPFLEAPDMMINVLLGAALVVSGAAMVMQAAQGAGSGGEEGRDQPRPSRFAIAIHGGAGTIDRQRTSVEQRQEYLDALSRVLRHGQERLAGGASALDVVEECVRMLEDDPHFNAGRGAVLTSAGTFELDASIMDGATLACGGVTGVTTVKNPVSLARLVMEKTDHVLLGAEGAEAFATETGVERVDPSYFETQARRRALEREMERRKQVEEQGRGGEQPGDEKRGTVGAVALDVHGNLAAATSTGGRTGKMPGRIGDTPINGAGNYANNASAAVSGTGVGEQFIRHAVARDVAALMEYRGLSLKEAARIVVFEKLREGDGGLIAVSRDGEITMPFNTPGMFRGAADWTGRFDVAIWRE
jgi:L-asparaginase / beta-aspartyl-peptidase